MKKCVLGVLILTFLLNLSTFGQPEGRFQEFHTLLKSFGYNSGLDIEKRAGIFTEAVRSFYEPREEILVDLEYVAPRIAELIPDKIDEHFAEIMDGFLCFAFQQRNIKEDSPWSIANTLNERNRLEKLQSMKVLQGLLLKLQGPEVCWLSRLVIFFNEQDDLFSKNQKLYLHTLCYFLAIRSTFVESQQDIVNFSIWLGDQLDKWERERKDSDEIRSPTEKEKRADEFFNILKQLFDQQNR